MPPCGAFLGLGEHMYKLLVVDDEEKIRELIGKYAKFEGHEVDFAEDGMQAIEKCRDNNYDIVIMDIMMPNLDGFSACREQFDLVLLDLPRDPQEVGRADPDAVGARRGIRQDQRL